MWAQGPKHKMKIPYRFLRSFAKVLNQRTKSKGRMINVRIFENQKVRRQMHTTISRSICCQTKEAKGSH